ncbi:hypothetical protein G6M17_07555 [Agrobacterium tumefaciens]|uniref:hypothetical protein n=1 Tax=Rhizobium/Agrobacterium group TaxID=227290 RepID=UPI0007DE5F3D|nr:MULTISPECIES: hypothetical protein [Rhizobium/Agrobacterium group]AQS61752.1 hypothetical protein B0909_05445 [Rhizobium rhizogenes]MCZ7443019.1 hypothetical protein [Rhizobium rhizogenes]NSZ79004.1 hypothetical protein [Agrobacterium tumefaciens]OAM65802.1 hypothetical protein A8L48_22680 [Rhizobium rhizogenes]
MIDADRPLAAVNFLHRFGYRTSISLDASKKALDFQGLVSGKVLKVFNSLLVGIIDHPNLMIYCQLSTPRTLPFSAFPNSERNENICKWSLFGMTCVKHTRVCKARPTRDSMRVQTSGLAKGSKASEGIIRFASSGGFT